MQKLAQICIRRPVFATMLILALVVVGLDAYRKLGVDYFPKVEFPFVSITTTLRGASPEEVESQVTKPLEEVINTISGIDELNSSSYEGVSLLIVGFVLEKDPEVAAQEVRDKISTVLAQLPKDADPPIIEKISTDAAPVLNVVLSSPRDRRETTKIADDVLKKNLESLNGVGQVRFVGERKRQIQVELDGGKLSSYNLNVEQVRGALAAQNIEVPGGRLDQGSREVSVRTFGRVEKPADFARIVVANFNASPVRIGDIAKVTDGVEEPRSFARLNGAPAVVLQIRKQAGTNTLDVIARVKERIGELKNMLPPDMQVTYARDQSGFIDAAFQAVQEHLVLGGFFAAFIVLLFIRNWRATLIAAVAIPTSIISTFSLMNLMGFTLNQITMLALTLMVGIVIDDAIVVLENIFRFMEEKHLDPVEAAIQGTKDIGLAVLATTLSLVIIFLPIAMMTGIIGRFMSSFGYTAAFAIMVSLLVSFTLTPMLCSRFLKRGGGNGHSGKPDGGASKDTIVFRALAGPYRAMLHWSLAHRWAIVVISIAVMAAIPPMMGRMGISFLPVEDQNEFEITIRMPVGTSLEGSEEMMQRIEQDVKKLPGVKDMLSTAGSDMRRQVDRGSIIVELVDVSQRKESQNEIMERIRTDLRKYPELVFGVQPPALITGGTDRELMYVVQGPDLEKLDQYSQRLMARLRRVPGVVDLESTYESGKPEVRVHINRDKAAELGVNVASIANAVRVLVGGDAQATTYKEGDDRYDVQLRTSKEFRTSAAAMERLYLPSATLGNVPLASVATLEKGTGPLSIDRLNRQRRVMIMGNIDKTQALSNVLPIIKEELDGMNMPPEYRHAALGRSKELGRAIQGYIMAFILSIIFMYMILASQFDSFVDPVTILLSLPLSVPFALLSLFLARENFSIIYTSLGILVLFGIVKKNAILQIDHIKSLRREGVGRTEAIFRGCEDRLRPILMTTAALVAGMIPLAVGSGAGAGSRRTVAIVVIGGQTLALLLTLLVTPVVYSLFDDLAHATLWRRIFAWRPRRAVALIALLALVTATGYSQERVGVGGAERPLTLEEAIQMAVRNNLELEVERTNLPFTQKAIAAARGAFDPLFGYNSKLESRDTPVASSLAAANGKLSERLFDNSLSLRQRTPWKGLAWQAAFDSSRQSTNNPFTSLSPFYMPRLSAGFTLPLLRGSRIDLPRAELIVRRKMNQQAEADFETRLVDVVTRVQVAYWDLAAARQDVAVERMGVQLSEEQLARNKRMIASGTLAPVEVFASEAELQRRRDGFISANGQVTLVENNLKMLLAPERGDPLWNVAIIPVTDVLSQPSSEDLAATVRSALASRPELKSLELRTGQAETQRQAAKDATRPQVNLTGTYWSTGLAGTAQQTSNPFSSSFGPLFQRINDFSALAGMPPIAPPSFGGTPPAMVGGYGQALSNMFGFDFQGFQAGLQVEWNFRNRAPQAALAQAEIQERRLKLVRRQLEQGIEAEVRNALQGVATARQRINAAQAAERAAREKLDSETRLFQTGESTNFFVLTRQNELIDAKRRAVAATLLLNRATARLQQAAGETLAANQIAVR